MQKTVGTPTERPAPTGMLSRRRQRSSALRRDQTLVAYIYLLPAMALFCIFMAYPILQTLWLSFYKVDQFNRPRGFIGLTNYTALIGNARFQGALINTLVWTINTVTFTIGLSLFLAVVLNGRFRGRTIARSMLLLPWATSLPIAAVTWTWIVDPDRGSLNHLLGSLGLLNGRFAWLGDKATSLPIMMWVATWVSLPFTTITLLAGLSTISHELYEAAAIDGATPVARFRFITLPLLRPVLAVVVVINVINVFNSSPIVWVMTQGGPAYQTHLLITYVYQVGFRAQELGKAYAASMLIFLMLLVFSTVYAALIRKRGE